MQHLKGLYAITQPAQSCDVLVAAVAQAIFGGARVIQYRDKSADSTRRLQEARALNALCQQQNIPLIINDDIQLAAQVKAHGVHLGKQDPQIAHARKLLGSQALIGVSCYNQFTLAEQAVANGADYVAFGSFYPSLTKPQAITAEIALLRQAKEKLSVPIVAIGGITSENAPPLIAAGADMLAVIQSVFSQPDIYAAAKQFAALYH